MFCVCIIKTLQDLLNLKQNTNDELGQARLSVPQAGAPRKSWSGSTPSARGSMSARRSVGARGSFSVRGQSGMCSILYIIHIFFVFCLGEICRDVCHMCCRRCMSHV